MGSGKKSKNNLGVATKTADNPAIQIGTAKVATAVKVPTEDVTFGADFSMPKLVGEVQNAAGTLEKEIQGINSNEITLILEPANDAMIFHFDLPTGSYVSQFPITEDGVKWAAQAMLFQKNELEKEGFTTKIVVSDLLPKDIQKAAYAFLNLKPYVARIRAMIKDGKIVVTTDEA